MIELPECQSIARQAEQALQNRRIAAAAVNHSPHRFAFFYGDPNTYPALLKGRQFTGARAFGGQLELLLEGARLILNDGASPRLLSPAEKRPEKHQLLLEMEDGGALCCTIQMYGGFCAVPENEPYRNVYYQTALAKPSPLSDAFDGAYFESLRRETPGKLSLKAFLATEQRIPGLGNGVLQDILYAAALHPKRRLDTLTDGEFARLYASVRDTLAQMTALDGRNTERDLFFHPGRYVTRCSKLTLGVPCPRCGTPIEKEAYLGGAVYFCPVCQPAPSVRKE